MVLSPTGSSTGASTAMAAALARTNRNRMEEDRDENKYANPENKYSKRRYQLDLQDEDLQRKYFAAMVVIILLSLFWLLGGGGGGGGSPPTTPNRKKHHIIDVQSQLRRPIRPNKIGGDERTDDIMPLRPMGGEDAHEILDRLVHQAPIPEQPTAIRQDPEEDKLDAIQNLKQYQESLKEVEVIMEEQDEIEQDTTDKDEMDHKLKIIELQNKFTEEE
jgi:hypothetical protein